MNDSNNPLIPLDVERVRILIAEPGRRFLDDPLPGQERQVTRAGKHELRIGFQFRPGDPYAWPEWLSWGFQALDLSEEVFEGTRLHLLRAPHPLLYCFAITDICLVNRDPTARDALLDWWQHHQHSNAPELGPIVMELAPPIMPASVEIEWKKPKRGLDV